MHQLGGCFGTPSFKLEHTDYDSFWHIFLYVLPVNLMIS
jgi:hypothetical protein